MKKVVAVMLAVAACSTTSSVIATWREPTAGSLDFKRLLIVAPVTDPALRRSIEDQAVASLPPGAVASYRLIPAGVAPQILQLDQIAQKRRFDAAIVVRVAPVAKERNWTPGAMVFGAWTAFDPLDIDSTEVRVETSVYALPSERAVFSCASATMGFENLRGLVEDTLSAVRDELHQPAPLVPQVSELPKTGVVAAAPRG